MEDGPFFSCSSNPPLQVLDRLLGLLEAHVDVLFDVVEQLEKDWLQLAADPIDDEVPRRIRRPGAKVRVLHPLPGSSGHVARSLDARLPSGPADHVCDY